MDRAQLAVHEWSSDYLATAHTIDKLLLKLILFRNIGISIQDSWGGIYLKIKRQVKMKRRRIAWSTGRMFSKSGQINKVLSKFRRVREQCPQPNTVVVLCVQKLSNFGFYVINKWSQWILVKYHLCLQKLLNLPPSLPELGNFWKHNWY